jgi:hypothetical protein
MERERQEGFLGSGVPMGFINLQIWACNRNMENAEQKVQAIRVFWIRQM